MKSLSERRQAYVESDIWNLTSPRNSCVVPERPLIISPEEERDLNELALAVNEAVTVAINTAQFSQEEPWYRYRDSAAPFPDGLTMPPAIRVDVVRTENGPKIVEIDPITALSIGETAFLANEWSEGHNVIESPVRQIANSVQATSANRLALNLPSAKADYSPEIKYLAQQLRGVGIDVVEGEYDQPSTIQLSSFYEVPSARKRLTKGTQRLNRNPLWGSLNGLSSKAALGQLMLCSERLRSFAVREYTESEIDDLPGDTLLVAKPIRGTGSVGLKTLFPADVFDARGFVFQESLEPTRDSFGNVMTAEGNVVSGTTWVTRLSIYAGRSGMVGAQVTARRPEGLFTNVDGKPDAVQTALAVDVSKDS